MHGISRYILRQLGLGMVLTTLGLTAVIWLAQSLRFIELIVGKGLSAGMFVYLTLLLLPNFLTIILPIAAFAVVTFVYNRLISDRELVVMRAVGLSPRQLAMPALVLAGGITLLSYAISLYFVPVSITAFKDMQFDIRNNLSTVLLREGMFNEINDHLTVYVRHRERNGELLGVLVHDTRDPDRPVTLMAEKGALVRGADGPQVLLVQGNRQEVDRKRGHLSMLYFDRYSLDLGALSKKPPSRWREPRERGLIEDLTATAAQVGADAVGKFRVEGHHRLTAPLLDLGFPMVALAFLLSGAFSRHGQNKRVVAAIAVVVTLQALTMAINDLAARHLVLVPLIYLNAILPIVLSWMHLNGRLRWPVRLVRLGKAPL